MSSVAARPAGPEEVRALKKRVAELERANEILKTSAAFLWRISTAGWEACLVNALSRPVGRELGRVRGPHTPSCCPSRWPGRRS